MTKAVSSCGGARLARAVVTLAACLAPAAYAGNLCVFHNRLKTLEDLRRHLPPPYKVQPHQGWGAKDFPPDDKVEIKAGAEQNWGTIETKVDPWPAKYEAAHGAGFTLTVHIFFVTGSERCLDVKDDRRYDVVLLTLQAPFAGPAPVINLEDFAVIDMPSGMNEAVVIRNYPITYVADLTKSSRARLESGILAGLEHGEFLRQVGQLAVNAGWWWGGEHPTDINKAKAAAQLVNKDSEKHHFGSTDRGNGVFNVPGTKKVVVSKVKPAKLQTWNSPNRIPPDLMKRYGPLLKPTGQLMTMLEAESEYTVPAGQEATVEDAIVKMKGLTKPGSAGELKQILGEGWMVTDITKRTTGTLEQVRAKLAAKDVAMVRPAVITDRYYDFTSDHLFLRNKVVVRTRHVDTDPLPDSYDASDLLSIKARSLGDDEGNRIRLAANVELQPSKATELRDICKFLTEGRDLTNVPSNPMRMILVSNPGTPASILGDAMRRELCKTEGAFRQVLQIVSERYKFELKNSDKHLSIEWSADFSSGQALDGRGAPILDKTIQVAGFELGLSHPKKVMSVEMPSEKEIILDGNSELEVPSGGEIERTPASSNSGYNVSVAPVKGFHVDTDLPKSLDKNKEGLFTKDDFKAFKDIKTKLLDHLFGNNWKDKTKFIPAGDKAATMAGPGRETLQLYSK